MTKKVILPAKMGKVSCFGGINDKYDRLNGLAYCNSWKFKSELDYLKYLKAKCPEFRKMFVDDETAKLIKIKYPKYKLSAYLDNKNADYIAMRFSGSFGLYGCKNPKIKVTNPKNKKSVICYRVDFGPGQHTGRTADLSDHALKTIGAKTDDVLKFELYNNDILGTTFLLILGFLLWR